MKKIYSSCSCDAAVPALNKIGRSANIPFIISLLFALMMPFTLFAQAPSLSYASGLHTYGVGTPITSLVPRSSRVSAAAYSANAVKLPVSFTGGDGLALDSAGNLYVGTSGTITKVAAGTYSTSVISYSGVQEEANDVAIDAAGNLFTSTVNTGNGFFSVVELPSGGGAPITLGASLVNKDFLPMGIAPDINGNIYVADYQYNGNPIIKIPAGNGTPVNIGPNVRGAVCVATDAAGNVYYGQSIISLAGTYEGIYKIPADGGAIVKIGNSDQYSGLQKIAIDASGNIFASYIGNDPAIKDSVLEYPANGGSPLRIATFDAPRGMKVDPAGNLYVVDSATYIKKVSPVGGYYISPTLPAGLIFNNNTGVISGTPTVITSPATYIVTAYNSNGSKSAAVKIATIDATTLKDISISAGENTAPISPEFSPLDTNYTVTIPGFIKSVGLIPTTDASGAAITINGVAVRSGASSGPDLVQLGPNIFTIVVTAPDNAKRTYTVNVIKGSEKALLSDLEINAGTLDPGFDIQRANYTVSTNATSITVTPTTRLANSTVTINGTPVISGTPSAPITLTGGHNVIDIVVTAPDKTTTKTYVITVSPPDDANLISLGLSKGSLSPAFTENNTTYSVDESAPEHVLGLIPVADNPAATVTFNGDTIKKGKSTGPQPLKHGNNTFTIIVTATDGITTKTYTINVFRMGLDRHGNSDISTQHITGDAVSANPAVSPNGDGINDVFTIKNIEKYPVNKVMVINKSGVKVYEVTGYNNVDKAFNGKSNITGRIQPAGTYYYELQYSENGALKTQTGYLVLRY